jgi:membrane-bound metal-dependent hydrolase YbcI (DUF457 family)
MPSPIAHAAVGAAVYRLWSKPDGSPRPRGTVVPPMLLGCVGLSFLPDLDAALGIFLGDLGRYHNNLAGSPVFGALVALATGGIVAIFRRSAFKPVFSLTFVCYQLHVFMDYFTVGRGVMVLWPFSNERFAPPFHLFYGLRWSDGLISERHLITLFSELAFSAALITGSWLLWRKRSSASASVGQDPSGRTRRGAL